jgi:antigen flippase
VAETLMSERAQHKSAGRGSSYTQILKSTALIGGSSLVNIAFSVIRMKAVAMLLGPSGVGLMSLYNSLSELAQTLAGLGIQPSGVRQIAEATGTEDTKKVARTAAVLKRVSVVLALVGAVAVAALAWPLSQLTFGDQSHVVGVMLLALVVLFGVLNSGQMGLLQGMRRIGDLARISMLSAFASAVLTVPLVYLFGEAGIVPALILTAAATFALSWWHSRRIAIEAVVLSMKDIGTEAADLLKLGVVFMASGFMTVGASYAVRLIVMQGEGVDAAGLYQAAWALGGLYAGFILQAMGTDFYPRLTAAAHDDEATNRLVNEQAHISILLAGPGLLATLTIAPILMLVFYSAEFSPAAELLRWLCLGMMLRIIAWPMGFIILARGARAMFFWTEVAATVVHVGLAWLLVGLIGLTGAGIAFFGLYLWHAVLVYALVRRLSGFRWSLSNLALAGLFLPAAGVIVAGFHFLPQMQAVAIGVAATAATGLYSLTALIRLFPERQWLRRSKG